MVTQWQRICLPMQEIQETQFWSLGWEDPLEKEMASWSNILPGECHRQRSPVGYSPWDCRVRHDWATEYAHIYVLVLTKNKPKSPLRHLCFPVKSDSCKKNQDIMVCKLLLGKLKDVGFRNKWEICKSWSILWVLSFKW